MQEPNYILETMVAYQCCGIQRVQNQTPLSGKIRSLKGTSRLQFEGSLLTKGEMVICLGCLPPNKLNVPGSVPRYCSQLAQDCLVHIFKLLGARAG